MRRGLIHWSHEELPPAALDARVARVQAAMRTRGLGAVLAYASFAQPAPLQWLCNYVPYWSEAVLVVWPEGAPTLLVAGTPRTHPWIRSVSHVGELVAAPRPGAQTAELLGRKVDAQARVGVIGLDALPWSVAEPLLAAGWGPRLDDASALYTEARHPGDEAELGQMRTAVAIADAAFAALPAAAQGTSALIAAVDGSARRAGAEEVLVRVAPDLARDDTLLRIEGERALGAHYAVDCALAYKGVWVRTVRSLARGVPPAAWAEAEDWYRRSSERVGIPGAQDPAAGAPGTLAGWTLEASTGLAPLSVVAGHGQQTGHVLPLGSLAMFSVQLELDGAPWLRSAALRLGSGALCAPQTA